MALKPGPYITAPDGKKQDASLHADMLRSQSGDLAFELSALNAALKAGEAIAQAVIRYTSPNTQAWLRSKRII